MKKSLLLISLLLSFAVTAKDMSKTENPNDVYKETPQGTLEYIGACSVHEDMKDTHFKVTNVLVKYMDLNDGKLSRQEFLEATKILEIDIVNKAESYIGVSIPQGIDDFRADKIESTKITGLDLYRLNIGIGGGNGMYLIYNRSVIDGLVNYELMSETFDGEVKLCDSKVWLFKEL